MNTLPSKQTNEIFPSGATLVEEEDFNELTAVPSTATAIVIAANGHAGSKRRQLPPLKLSTSTTSGRRGGEQNSADDEEYDDIDHEEEYVAFNVKSNGVGVLVDAPSTAAAAAATTTTSKPKQQTETIEPYENALSTTTSPTNSSPTTTIAIASNNTNAVSGYGYGAGPATHTTTTTYSHNSKTTRSWPVIYRNPHHYDYEALYAQAAATITGDSNPQQQASTLGHAPPPSVTFKQNCYSNQFAQSILYSSSNEDLTAINERAELAAGQPTTTTPTSYLNSSATGQRNGGGAGNNNNNYAYGGYTNVNGYTNSSSNQQTTCYYFAPSRHNSIYEHPSALQFDPTVATTAAAAAAVESLRRSNSFLLRNNSCSKAIQHAGTLGGAAADSPTSINSAMDSGSNTGSSACCSNCCVGPPPVLFLFFTLLMTTSATAMLCAAIMTDHWEHVTWDRTSLDYFSNRSGLHLEWTLNDKVAMLRAEKKEHRFRRETVFLVPMHGGIWTLCIDLPIPELQELRRSPRFPRGAPPCVNYLAGSMENARGEEQRNDWQHSESQATLQPHLRMQNLSISCSLVCLIILGSAALVGAFGVCQRQISAILITGVMYLLAALFALFTLMIIHFKRKQGHPMLDSDYDGTVDGIVARPGGVAIMAKDLLGARIFLTSWSLDLGWGGVVLCAITSVLWILLSKIMRYNPFSALMI